ncbi:hypothetical protein ACVWZ6_002614 [Bradyrhizobium sp. GM6.1]
MPLSAADEPAEQVFGFQPLRAAPSAWSKSPATAVPAGCRSDSAGIWVDPTGAEYFLAAISVQFPEQRCGISSSRHLQSVKFRLDTPNTLSFRSKAGAPPLDHTIIRTGSKGEIHDQA